LKVKDRKKGREKEGKERKEKTPPILIFGYDFVYCNWRNATASNVIHGVS